MSTKSLAAVAAPIAADVHRIAEEIRTMPDDERLARNILRFGWSPNARCPDCGDTGREPYSQAYCRTCPAGPTQKAADETDRRAREIERAWVTTGVPRRFRGYRLETSPACDAIPAIREWLADAPVQHGVNLILIGPTGTGKTGLAIGALWKLHEAGFPSLEYVSTIDLLESLRPPSGDDATLRSSQHAGVLLLDDLGASRGTEWEQDRLFALVNRRYERQKPTIVTTNVALPDLAQSLGERTISRLTEGATVVVVAGDDLRR